MFCLIERAFCVVFSKSGYFDNYNPVERLNSNIGLVWSPVPRKAVWKSLIKIKFNKW